MAKAKRESLHMSNGTEEIKPSANEVWLSLAKEAPAYANRSHAAIVKAIKSDKFSAIFADHVRAAFDPSLIQSTIEVAQSALDAWLTMSKSVGNRGTRNGMPRRHDLRMPDAIAGAVYAALEPFYADGLTVASSYKPRTKTDVVPVTTEVTSDLFDQELVVA